MAIATAQPTRPAAPSATKPQRIPQQRRTEPSGQGSRPTPAEAKPKVRKRAWEIKAQVAIDDIRGMAERAGTNGKPGEAVKKAARGQIASQLSKAESYLDTRASPLTYARGTRLEGAWLHIHNANVAAVELMDSDELVAYSPQILALAEKHLKRGKPPAEEPTLTAIKVWHKARKSGETGDVALADRHALAHALKESYERVANEYHRLRRFQAAVIVGTVLVLMLVGGLIALGAKSPESVPLCFPDDSAIVSQPVGAGAPACPSGSHVTPGSADVAAVALFGLLGAALVGVRLIIRPSAASSVPMATTRWFQALLKVATGMLTAILGLLFLRAGVVPGFTQVDTQSQILVYAVVFGASQELITRLVDQRSNHLLAAVTSSEAAPNQPADSKRES